MKSISLVAVIPLLFIGCANHPVADKTVTPESSVAASVPHNCQFPQDQKRRVFHSMYADQESAEKAYTKLSAYSPELQYLQLMMTARQESIDSSTRNAGGDLGYIKFSSFDKSFATAVFHLPLKRLSHPIQSKFGWHIVWVSDALDIKTNAPCE